MPGVGQGFQVVDVIFSYTGVGRWLSSWIRRTRPRGDRFESRLQPSMPLSRCRGPGQERRGEGEVELLGFCLSWHKDKVKRHLRDQGLRFPSPFPSLLLSISSVLPNVLGLSRAHNGSHRKSIRLDEWIQWAVLSANGSNVILNDSVSLHWKKCQAILRVFDSELNCHGVPNVNQ